MCAWTFWLWSFHYNAEWCLILGKFVNMEIFLWAMCWKYVLGWINEQRHCLLFPIGQRYHLSHWPEKSFATASVCVCMRVEIHSFVFNEQKSVIAFPLQFSIWRFWNGIFFPLSLPIMLSIHSLHHIIILNNEWPPVWYLLYWHSNIQTYSHYSWSMDKNAIHITNTNKLQRYKLSIWFQ